MCNYIAWVDRNSEKTVKREHTDNAVEFIPMRDNLKWMGIVLTTTSAYSPEPDEFAEEMNRTISKKVCTLFKQAGMANNLWGEAIYHAAFL